MASLSSLRDGLKTRLLTISGLRAFDTIPDQVPVPCGVVGGPENVDYDVVMRRGADRWILPVRIYASRASERAGQDLLDGYLDSTSGTSVKAAIENDPTLGGQAQTLRVTQARGYGQYRIGDIYYIGCEWLVEIIA